MNKGIFVGDGYIDSLDCVDVYTGTNRFKAKSNLHFKYVQIIVIQLLLNRAI